MPNLTNLARLRGRVIDALRLLSVVEDEAAAQIANNSLPLLAAEGVH